MAQSREHLRTLGLPFEPLEIHQEFLSGDRSYVSLWYRCPKLSAEGRCSIYPVRPDVCRIFVPGENDLCVFGRMMQRDLARFEQELHAR